MTRSRCGGSIWGVRHCPIAGQSRPDPFWVTHCRVWDTDLLPRSGAVRLNQNDSVDLSHLAHLVRSSPVRHEKAPTVAGAEFRWGAWLVKSHVPHEHFVLHVQHLALIDHKELAQLLNI